MKAVRTIKANPLAVPRRRVRRNRPLKKIQRQLRAVERQIERRDKVESREVRRVKRAFHIHTGSVPRPTSYSALAADLDEVTGSLLCHSSQVDESDPTFDAATREADAPQSTAEWLALAKQAVIVPDNFIQRCTDGPLLLVSDDEGVRFVERFHDEIPDAVPWRDAPGPIPSVALNSPGGMAHHHSKRKQVQKLARSATRGLHRPSQKPRSSA